ncbi:glycosyltransferase involved in cell wall biosynthesis [Maritalea mobilis]|uniref:Glycosyltransferase involved in cell wall biosynthesis n=1 Tax=Maritalea mobilis TaxID=483324 RepID=A0A4R6VDM2_9HYPH|nr:glycosyltransferase family 4 protein [Maritalea mobilis]TDQ60441.1 glycosyltransferase involved in cell wall biosynthesis [Maritalea mobilis]
MDAREKTGRKKVTIVGTIPPPIGGVSVFISRLLPKLQEKYDVVLWDTKKKSKAKEGRHSILTPFNSKLLTLAWVIWMVLRVRPRYLHFHFSNVISLVFLALILKPTGSRFAVTLHHGRLEHGVVQRFLVKSLRTRIASRIDRFHALNEDQRLYFQDSLGIPPHRISVFNTHLMPVTISFLSKAECENVRYVLTSGVGVRENRFDQLIRYWVGKKPDLDLYISCYGNKDQEYISELKSAASQSKRISFLPEMSELEFNRYLSNSALYVRPAEVDSFGIVAADAICFGVPVLASDACKRADGCVVYKNKDYSQMATLLDRMLKVVHTTKFSPSDNWPKIARFYDEFLAD